MASGECLRGMLSPSTGKVDAMDSSPSNRSFLNVLWRTPPFRFLRRIGFFRSPLPYVVTTVWLAITACWLAAAKQRAVAFDQSIKTMLQHNASPEYLSSRASNRSVLIPRGLLNADVWSIQFRDTTLNNLQFLEPFAPTLNHLDVSNSQLQARVFSDLDELPRLRNLKLYNCTIADGAFDDASGALQMLDLSYSNFSDQLLRGARNLTFNTVNLNSTPVGDEVLQSIFKQTWLTELFLRDTNVGDASISQLPQRFDKSLRVLELDRTKITDACLPAIANLRTLHALSLNETAVTFTGVQHLTTLQTLQVLDLRGTKVTEEEKQHLRKMLPGVSIQ